MRMFEKGDLMKLFKPSNNSSGEQNGQVTIIGGSSLFHGAPILALKIASRVVDMVFFASPEPSVGEVVAHLKSQLSSFIWIPWDEVDAYIEKSDAVLIGPGLMRYKSDRPMVTSNKLENSDKLQVTSDKSNQNILLPVTNNMLHLQKYDTTGQLTRDITKRLLLKYPTKKWVIDAGSLQTMDVSWIPPKAIITPNAKELEILFKLKSQNSKVKTIIQNLKLIQEMAKKYNCIIVAKGVETIVASPDEAVVVKGGNPGLTKGGSGDVLAGLTVGLLD